MKKFLSLLVALAMVVSLFSGIMAPSAKAAGADGLVLVDATGTKKIDSDAGVGQDYFSTEPTLTTEGHLDTLPDGDYVYNMGDIITGRLTLGGVATTPANPWKVSLVQFPNTVIDFVVVSAGVGTFTIGTANVRFDGPYFLRVESLGGEFTTFDMFNNTDAAGAANLYIKYNVAWVLDTITPCAQLQKVSGYVTRGNGQTVDVPVFVGVAYPGTADDGKLASYYSISRLSSGQFAMTFLGVKDPGLYRVFFMDGYYDAANDPTTVLATSGNYLNYSHGIIDTGVGTAGSNWVLDQDALVYKTISTIPTAFSMKAALFTNPVYLYKQQIGQSLVISVTDAYGKPVTGADWFVENTSGALISSSTAPAVAFTGTEIDDGYYRFDIDTTAYTGTDLRFYFKSTLYGQAFTSNKIVVDLRDKGAWNPYLQIDANGGDDANGTWVDSVGRWVYDNLPCTIGSSIWMRVGYWAPVPATDYSVYDTTVTFTGPLSYMSGTLDYDGDGTAYYRAGEWYHFRITKAGAIGASLDVTMWERQDPAYPLDANNACCKTFTKTFSVCEVKSCTTTSVQVGGASSITVGSKGDLVISVDPTGAPADLFCGCNSKIVRVYMTKGANIVTDAFTVDTYGGGTPVTVGELWYNGIPESLATYGATATCPAPTGKSADGTVTFQQTTPGIVAVDNCTTLTFKGVQFNYATGTDCRYRLVVEVFGEQRGYDQCGVLCPSFPFISESVNPVSINPVTTAKTATATIYEAGVDPSQILAGVPATVEITDPAFSAETSSKWGEIQWSFSFKAAGDDTFHAFDYWGFTSPTVSEIDTGYRFSSFCVTMAGTIEIYAYSYNEDDTCNQLEELAVDVEAVMPTFEVKTELLDGTMLENDGILTKGFGETVYVTATDPREDAPHDFSTDSTWHLDAAGRKDSCGLRTALVCLDSPTGCIGCAGGNALTISSYDNPCLEGAGKVRLYMVTACGSLKIADFTVTDPTVAVDPATVPFTIPASATHVTFTVKDAHGHGAPGVTVSISGDMSPSTGASGYSWTAGSVQTGKDPMGEADWAFVPPFSGQYKVIAEGDEPCESIPAVWTTKYAALGATITAKYQAPVVDTEAPVVTVTAGLDGSTVSAEVLSLTGKVTDNVGVSQLYVGFNKVDVLPDGSFMTSIKLAKGENTISIVAYDAAGNKGTAAVKVTYTPPVDNTIVLVLTVGADVVSVNGKATSIDAAPEIVAGRTFVPIRFISESFGATVDWLAETQGITITLGDHTIGLQIGNATAVIDGNIDSLPAAPYIKNGRTMVPLRVISEAFGGDVVWDPAARTITITYVP